MKKLLLFVCLSLFSYSNDTVVNENTEKEITLISSLVEEVFTPDLNYLNTLEKGIKRDFYVNEFLQLDISSEDAFKTLSLIDNMNDEIFHNFAKKFKHDETLAVSQCLQMSSIKLVDTYADCIAVGLSLDELSKMSAIELDLIKQRIGNKYPLLSKQLKVISSSIPFTKLIPLRKDELYTLYFGVDIDFRTKYFNYKLPKRTFTKLFEDKFKFDKFLDITLRNRKQNVINKSLLTIDDKELNANSSFLLALNAIEFKDLNKAFVYLENSLNKSTSSLEKDKSTFWLYKITKNEEYLKGLLENNNINIYTILASEYLSNEDLNLNIKFVEEFDLYIKEYELDDKALFYTIANEKSNFDIKKVSKDFELGIMQLDINLFKSISQNIAKRNYNLLKEVFEYDTNISLTKSHVDIINNISENPILKLLAYENKNKILKKIKNIANNEHEPFLGLEFLLNEDNQYIKNMIAKYYLYYNILIEKKQEKLSLTSTFQTLMKSSQTSSE